MIKKQSMILVSISLIFIILVILLTIPSLAYNSNSTGNNVIATKLTKATITYLGETHSVNLPYSCKNIPSRTPINVNIELPIQGGQSIYVKSVYAPLSVYANSQLIYEYGKSGSYPNFMKDPPTNVDIIPLPKNDGSNILLKLEYLSPSARDTLTIQPLILGTERTILTLLFKEMGFNFIFSIILLILGLLFILVSIFITSFEKKGIAFIWLGIFAISVGTWGFGECNLTILFIHNPVILYIAAFTGLILIPISLMPFILQIIKFKKTKPIYAVTIFYGIAAIIALIMQLTGTVSLYESVFAFHILIPLSLCFIALYTFIEWLKNKSNNAKRFVFPITILAIFSLLKVMNYVFRFTNVLSLFFQIGILIFIIADCIIGGLFIRDSIQLRDEKQKLQFELNTLEYRVQEEQRHNQLVLHNAQEIKQQRHDLRHQLAVIQGLNVKGSNKKLAEYLDTLVTQIPSDDEKKYCENEAVNAIVSHYASIADKEDIHLSIKLIITEHLNEISDNNLCIVFGNLLENAIEACKRMNTGDRFIKLNSKLHYGTLTITMDNSFDGKYTCVNNKFRSSKRDNFGVGLNSILSIAEKHDGNALFEAEGNIFKSSVYLHI